MNAPHLTDLSTLTAQHARTEAAVESVGAELRQAEAAISVPSGISIPVTRQVARLIAEGLRAKAASVYSEDHDLAVELETVADEFESGAMDAREWRR